ncbi:hypothetical protein BVX95_00310 [archaeon D22]|nr:hypothetical protein BVX95_00310 [archaeon D22]
MLKRNYIIKHFFIFFLIILNVFDFFEALNPEFDLIKKVISWVLMIYLLYHFSFSKILIGYKDKNIDLMLLFSYTLFIFKDLFFYLLGSELSIRINESIVFYTLNISLLCFLLISHYLSFYKHIEGESLLGIFKVSDNVIFKFILSLIGISFVAYFIFMMVFQWFTIVIDAPIMMIAIIYYLYVATKQHKADSLMENIVGFGDNILERFISFFHYKKTLYLGLLSLLGLHFFTDIFALLMPSIFEMGGAVYKGITESETIIALFFENITGLTFYEIFNLLIIYLANIIHVLFLLATPIILIQHFYKEEKIRLPIWLKLMIIPSFIISYIYPVYTIEKITSLSSNISGVILSFSSVILSEKIYYVLALLLILIFLVLMLYHFKLMDTSGITLIILFVGMVDYVSKYYMSTVKYYIALIQNIWSTEFLIIIFFFIIFILLITLFYWFSIIIFAFEVLKYNYLKSFMDRNLENFRKLEIFFSISLLFILLIQFLSIMFAIFRIKNFNFFVPIILAALFVVLPRINLFFVRIDWGAKMHNFLLTPFALLVGLLIGSSAIYYREPLGFVSENIILIAFYLLFVAISEELLFRHYLQKYLSNVFDFRHSALVQSLLFAFFHLTKSTSISLFILMFISAILFTIIKEKTGLLNAILAHFMANAILYYYFLF